MSNRQKEKLILDESLILDMTQGHEFNQLRNSPSPKRMQVYGRDTSNRKGGVTTPKRDRSNMDISLDDQYLEQVDAIEQQNASYQLEIKKIEA